MYAPCYQVDDYCRDNCIDYVWDSSHHTVLLNNEFWFDLETNFDVFVIETYIDIIAGKNKIVNMICEKLNTSVKNGCSFKGYKYFKDEEMCVNNNTFILTIDNIDMMSDKVYTAYDTYKKFELKIYIVSSQLKYYLINNDKTEVEFSKKLVDEKCTE